MVCDSIMFQNEKIHNQTLVINYDIIFLLLIIILGIFINKHIYLLK